MKIIFGIKDRTSFLANMTVNTDSHNILKENSTYPSDEDTLVGGRTLCLNENIPKKFDIFFYWFGKHLMACP